MSEVGVWGEALSGAALGGGSADATRGTVVNATPQLIRRATTRWVYDDGLPMDRIVLSRPRLFPQGADSTG
jgi:hypothetical protein